MNLTLLTRKIIFYGLVLLFVALSPYLVSHAFGYAFNFSNWEVKQTGGIFIKSKNPRVRIALDGTYAKETSLFSGNALITELSPGPHDLEILKEGHFPWRKKITVHPLVVTELRDIVLVPESKNHATSTPEEMQAVTTEKALRAVPKEGDLLFSLNKKGDLARNAGTTTEVVASRVHSYAPAKEKILFVNKDGFLSSLDLRDGALSVLGRPGFYLANGPLTFIPSPNGDTAILDSSGGLFLLDREGALTTVGGGIQNVIFGPSGAKALLVKEKGVEILWREKNPYQPFQEPGAREEILALDERVRDAAWFYEDTAHIIVRTDSHTLFVDADGRGGHYVQELFSGAANEIVTTPAAPAKVFYRVGEEYRTIAL